MDFTAYFSTRNLTKTPNVGTHYEQKTTPDLLWAVAQAILDITSEDGSRVFTDGDIRSSTVYETIMRDYFSKPPQVSAKNEFNKLSKYQMGVLVHAQVLEQLGGPRKPSYRVLDRSVLEFMATNDLNAARFLTAYTDKLLADNALLPAFEKYQAQPTQTNYIELKDLYFEWAQRHTKIRTKKPTHSNRVFNKIFNVYAYGHRIPGEHGARVKTGPCPYSYLIYNRKNFRDAEKPPEMSRKKYREQLLADVDAGGVVRAVQIQRAKEDIKRKYSYESEIQEPEHGYLPNGGVHVHHMLPSHAYPEFVAARENLIALTPGQHYSNAHPQGNTQRIDPEYQLICLRRKLEHIEESLAAHEDFYKLPTFVRVVNTALEGTLPEDSDVAVLRVALG